MTKISVFQRNLEYKGAGERPSDLDKRLKWHDKKRRIEAQLDKWERLKFKIWHFALPMDDFFCAETGQHYPTMRLIEMCHNL